ncbi:hypothetical protein ANCDUO_03178 [Ancylostoma duodenale]|uniref:Uncharacterized protein n=1 Tax=Ancylostoma duodenale TaxID=51022 RepID=A0A0C2GYB8_9BILA|nr:hypothetical protein ANCDUO_03178 [Ancylostoma duodenale]
MLNDQTNMCQLSPMKFFRNGIVYWWGKLVMKKALFLFELTGSPYSTKFVEEMDSKKKEEEEEMGNQSSKSEPIDDKLKRIAWVGIDEESDDQSTRSFDLEILREVIYTSGVELIREFEQDQIMDIL